MKKWIILGVVSFAAMNAVAQSTSQQPEVDKTVLVTPLNYEMGRIPAGKPLEYNVTIRNIGRDTLWLRDVKAGCGCTTPKFRSNEAILPGKSTYITLGFNGDAHGEFTKFADAYFNDGSLTKHLTFHGTAVSDSTSLPRQVNINR